jgi:hypothetical protein
MRLATILLSKSKLDITTRDFVKIGNRAWMRWALLDKKDL